VERSKRLKNPLASRAGSGQTQSKELPRRCNGELETAVEDWQAKIRILFDLSGVDKGENFMVSHRLRDTFAVECLLAGVPLERVSILLGHSTIKVTERHYAPWIQKRQQQLDADLRAMWSNDEQGTKQVQPQNRRPN